VLGWDGMGWDVCVTDRMCGDPVLTLRLMENADEEFGRRLIVDQDVMCADCGDEDGSESVCNDCDVEGRR